jgi:hypothetical protein
VVRYAAEDGSALSYRRRNKSENVERDRQNDRPPAVSQPRSRKPATVSASALAILDYSRTYIGKLEAEGVIQRQGDGFPLDQSRIAYLRYLRRERQHPRSAADATRQIAAAFSRS